MSNQGRNVQEDSDVLVDDTLNAESEPVVTVNKTGLVALVLIIAVLVPLFLLLIIAINLAATIVSTILFELLGHILLRAYGHKGTDVRLKTSVQVGAVGGAIVAIPFNIIYAALESIISPPVVIQQDTEEQGATEPLLQAQHQEDDSEQPSQTKSGFRSISSIYGTTQKLNNGLRHTNRNPFSPRMYANQREVESPSKVRLWLALIVDCLSGPALGASAGAVGSAVLRRTGHATLEVAAAAEAGALGGFALGAIAAFVFSAIFTCAFGAWWMSRRS